MGLTYRGAGVNIKAGEEAVNRIKERVKTTFGSEVLTELGGFGALFAPDLKGYKNPVLVSGTDGVGTKLKIAFMMNKHDTIGVDLVAMCVNDILAQGAKPLFFLDYLATGHLDPNKVEEIIKGITTGCQDAGCALIGGETAEMPDFYGEEEYDLAGFVVGIVDRDKVVTGEKIEDGDRLLGLASSGIHSNGYSLVRKIFFDVAGYSIDEKIEELGTVLGNELLKSTRIYVNSVLKLLKKFEIKGIAHITGGGLLENIPRILPGGMKAVIKKNSWPKQPVFNIMQEIGKVDEHEMYKTFNMGIGMVLIVSEERAENIMKEAISLGEKAYLIGEVKKGDSGIEIV